MTSPDGVPYAPPYRADHAAGPVGPAAPVRPPVPHRPGSTMILVANVLGVVALVALAVGGVVLAVLATRPVPGDGPNEPYGLFIGAAMVAVGVVLAPAPVVMLVQVVRARRKADLGSPAQLHAVATTAHWLAVVAAGLSLPAALLLPPALVLVLLAVLQMIGAARTKRLLEA